MCMLFILFSSQSSSMTFSFYINLKSWPVVCSLYNFHMAIPKYSIGLNISIRPLPESNHLISQWCWTGILDPVKHTQMTGLCLRSLMFTPSLESQHLGLIFNTLQKISSLPSYRQFKIWSQTSPVQFGTVLTDFSWKVCVSDTHHATHAHINHESLIKLNPKKGKIKS